MTKRIRARQTSPDQEDAPKSTRRPKRLGKRVGARPLDAEIRRAAARAGIRTAVSERTRLTSAARADLSALLSGGLWTYDNGPGDELRAEEAVCHVVAAQLKALTLALATCDDHPGWCLTDDRLTEADVAAVLSAAIAMLKSTHRLIPELRQRRDLVDGLEQLAARRTEGEMP
jgi:hypothetical protein